MFAILKTARKSVAALALTVAGFALSACGGGGGIALGGGGPAASGGPVQVALLLPYGSGVSTDELVARNLENAAKLAVADLGGEINLKVYPTGAKAAQASASAKTAIAEGAQVILGPLYAEAANAAGLAAAGSGVNVLAFSNNTAIAGGNVFLLGSTFENSAKRLVRYGKGQGRDRILIVHAQNPAGEQGQQAIARAISANGAILSGTVSYEFSQQGIVSAMPRAAKLANSSGANSVFLTAGVDADLPFVSKLLPEAGVTPGTFQYMGLTRWDGRPQLFTQDGIQGGWFTMPDTQRYAQFESRYQSTYGSRPHVLAGLAYDGMAAIGALNKSGRAISGTALTQGSGFSGVYGAFRLRSDGTNERALAVATIEGNSVKVIDAAPKSFGGIGF
ncbi:penicillin-binding protein activator [Brevirhabdus pacifica]|uniref:Penicillin-binding protein activator n=1 Tax=Brevirhabdus pacifica TaxID=1267768 RepID=A0A1U7DK19_9RHOB|nr:penicillin-binding protein activator [Brevirhabdus pacifica]APX90243.1 penicillin-binding protein activator [Brevirhabdus pacifica]OWU78709.1 ABC transporter substrate-binding protein [Loktanella sp. 22II-4b]PJJ80681.1 amino acid/amide ABC transporter substrate-binding protein (HAAT family) [Brevirhabdus pacifica]